MLQRSQISKESKVGMVDYRNSTACLLKTRAGNAFAGRALVALRGGVDRCHRIMDCSDPR